MAYFLFFTKRLRKRNAVNPAIAYFKAYIGPNKYGVQEEGNSHRKIAKGLPTL